MKLSELKTATEVIENDLDPEFRAEWDRTAFAREVAIAVVRFRVKHNLTQRQLASITGISYHDIVGLELGDSLPRIIK